MKSTINKIAAGIALLAAATTASAAFIPGGQISIGGAAVKVTLGDIDWNAPMNTGIDLTPTFGQFNVDSFADRTGIFSSVTPSGITATPDGYIRDMSQNPGDANYFPLGAANVSNFLSFGDLSNLIFTATYLTPGMSFAVPTVNGPMTITSPYTLTQTGNSVFAQLNVSGIVCDTEGDSVCNEGDDFTSWTAALQTTYVGTTVNGLLNTLLTTGELRNNSWSGTVEVPEPASLALTGLALLGLGAMRRRKSEKAA